MLLDHKFVVDVLDDSDDRLGAGPLYNVISIAITEELDRAGKVEVTVPATDERAVDLLEVERRLRIRTADGEIAYGLIHDLEINAEREPTLTASGPDALGELIHHNTLRDRRYDDLDIASAILGSDTTAESLLENTGWTQGDVDAGMGNASIVYDRQTILQSIILLAETVGKHFRQDDTIRQIDFGTFGADSGVRITNVHHVLVAQTAATEGLAYIGRAEVATISADIENRIYPTRSGDVDLRHAPTTISDIYVTRQPGPNGAATTLSSGVSVGDGAISVADDSDLEIGEEIWIGDADDWTANHELFTVAYVSSGSVALGPVPAQRGTISGATNATPIVISSTDHNLETGDEITVYGVDGNTAANGEWTVTVVNTNSFSLDGSVGNGAYSSSEDGWFMLDDEPEREGDVEGATNATPIVITSKSHGLSTGDKVIVYDVGGNADANGYWTVTRVNANTFSLDTSSGSGAYTSGGKWFKYTQATVALANGSDVIQCPQFYIEDATSQASYGVREACPNFNWIVPVDEGDQALEDAANMLYQAASARLDRYAEPYNAYRLGKVFNLPSDLRVGQKVRVVYHGAISAYGGSYYVDIDDNFYVVKIRRRWRGDGLETATVEVANVARPTPDNEGLVLDGLEAALR